MNRYFKIGIIAVLAVILSASTGYCLDRNNWGNTDTYQLLGRELPYDVIYCGYARGGASTMVSTASSILDAGLAFGILTKSAADGTAAQNTIGLANGTPGQMITIRLTLKGTNSFIIDKTCIVGGTTTTGWSTLTFDTSLDSITLLYLDDTIGWIIVGNSGVTVA